MVEVISMIQADCSFNTKRVSGATNPFCLSCQVLFQTELHSSSIKRLAAFANARFNTVWILKNG